MVGSWDGTRRSREGAPDQARLHARPLKRETLVPLLISDQASERRGLPASGLSAGVPRREAKHHLVATG